MDKHCLACVKKATIPAALLLGFICALKLAGKQLL